MSETERQFYTFRENHQYRMKTIQGKKWALNMSGEGEQTIVVLPGAGAFGASGAQVMFPLIAELEKQFRVLSLGYPTNANTVSQLVEGIKVILEEEHISHPALLGHSLGSLVTLCFLVLYPQEVNSVVLANFAIPSPAHVRNLELFLTVMIRFPRWLTIRLVKSQFRRLLKDYPDDFWLPFLTGREADALLRYIPNEYRCMLDFLRNWHVSREQFSSWPGRVLLLESDQERITSQERTFMETLFPNETVHVFRQAGHLSFITHSQEFVETVTRFLTSHE